MSTKKYIYNGAIPTWLPGVGVLRPGQVFESRYPVVGNPDFAPSSEEVSEPVGCIRESDPVCKKCIRVKNMDKKAKKKE